jgi:hypothetical protein
MSRTGSIVPLDVVNIATLEAAYDLHDRVYFADVAEELVAEAFAALAPFTSPAISTNSIAAEIIFCEWESLSSISSRESGPSRRRGSGSIVQKG